MKGFITYATYDTIDNQTFVKLFGRLENGQSFVALKQIFPYFYIQKKKVKKLSKTPKPVKIENLGLRNFSGDFVSKISFNTRADLNNSFKATHKKTELYEADIRPHYRFLIENNIFGGINLEGDYTSTEKIDRIYENPEITPSDHKPKLKVLSLDIETGKSKQLYCIGLSSENYKMNFMITDKKLKNTVSCKNESDCLEKFRSELLKFDPDIITGWNVIDFDLAYLRNLFKENEVSFDLGRTNEETRLRIESNFFRSSSVDIQGRQVLDGLNLFKDPFIKEAPSIKHAKFESLALEEVAQGILNKGKLLKGPDRHKKIEDLYKSQTTQSLQKLVDYNLRDCELVYEILEKSKILDLAIERSQLTGLTLDRLSGSIAAFDSLYIREAKSRGLVSPTMHYKPKEEKITGGYVQSAQAGIFKNVIILDFKSLYPSIIRTFNIDPSSYLEKKERGAIESPNKAYFKNTEGVLPAIIERLHKAREKAKKENRELSNHAIKVTMSSFFGVLASPNCRYFSLKIANAITHFGQFIIKLTAKEIEKKGYKVIYSDTDSVFVETKLPKTKANALGKEIEEEINKFYDEYVKKNYNRKSILELEFEKQYLSMMIPQLRDKSGSGAKKRYAGLIETSEGKEKLEIVGLEAVRGDWTEAAQDFQKELLLKLFHDEPIERFIRAYIKKIKDGKLDEKLVYKKSIRKPLSEYTKTTPPHVKAARKLPKLESSTIFYYITTDGPEPIQQLKHKLDYDHYIEKQISPIANQILVLLNKDFKDVSSDSKQAKLFTF